MEYKREGNGMRGMVWERPIQHSIRPKGGNGFLMPYYDISTDSHKIRLSMSNDTLQELRMNTGMNFLSPVSWSRTMAQLPHCSRSTPCYLASRQNSESPPVGNANGFMLNSAVCGKCAVRFLALAQCYLRLVCRVAFSSPTRFSRKPVKMPILGLS